MIYLVNDTAVTIRPDGAVPRTQGGSSTYVSGLINYLLMQKVEFGLIGNYVQEARSNQTIYPIKINSNAGFILGLIKVLFHQKFNKKDILYFQRPDHLAVSLFMRADRLLHLHGQSRTIIIESRKKLTRTIYLILERITMRIADKVIVTDQRTASLYIRHYPSIKNKIHILPAGIDYSFFTAQPIAGTFIKSANEKRLVYIGRLAYPKRLFDMVDSFEIVSRTCSQSTFYMAGTGPLLAILTSYIEKKGLQDRVILTGILNKTEVRDLIYSCDAAILLSYHEGSPISAKEILACGKPVIANDAGDMKDYVIDDVSGYIVDAANHDMVAEAVIKTFDNSSAMRDACIESMKKYDEMVINERICHILSYQ